MQFNGYNTKVQHSDVMEFPILERATTSIAPAGHQHHVMRNGGSFATSPAPQGFIDSDEFMATRPVSEVDKLSVKSQRTTVSQNSWTSLGGIQMHSNNTRPPTKIASANGKLSPLPNHSVSVKKLATKTKPLKHKKAKKVEVHGADNGVKSRVSKSTPFIVVSPLNDNNVVEDI